MSRPLCIEFAGALYHVTSRGDRREPIYEDDQDRESFLAILSDVMAQMHWLCHAYCLMTNHYHLLIETPDANLAKGMRQLNGIFTQASNRRHRRGGHLFQGRYKAIVVDKDSYLLELARYIVLNPVRAGMVALPSDWPWSSFRAMAGLESAPAWLETEGVLALFGEDRSKAQQRFGEFVMAGRNAASPWEKLIGQIYLGDDKFVKRVQGSARQGKEDIEAVTVCLGGAVAGFLFWNFPKAKIFMGDAGSGFVGMVLGMLSIQAAWVAPELFWGWVILLGAFVVDATVTLVRRVRRGERFYQAHRSHAYQYAARRYGAHPPVSLAFGAINIFWLLPVAALVAVGWLDGVLGVVMAYLPLIWLAVRFKAGARELQEV